MSLPASLFIQWIDAESHFWPTLGVSLRNASMNSRWGSHREVGAGTGVTARAGGHPGAVCLLNRKMLLVGADGMAGNTRDPLNLSLAGIGL